MNKAPVALFVYNRPRHTQQTVEELQKNDLASESDLFIFSDAAKNDAAKQTVDEVRAYIKSVDGFKKITIIEREKNWGLADSIIDGVTKIVNQYGKIIVLEDDLVTSPCFLRFMNEALDFYQNEEKVWHISGWNYPINSDGLNDVFLWRVMNCWGWATWADRWANFEKNPHRLIEQWTDEQKYHFDLDGSGIFWYQVTSNEEGRINTWAIFWYATIYQKQGLCLNPTKTYVDNIGHDGSGVHCGDLGLYLPRDLNERLNLEFDCEYVESKLITEKIKNHYQSLKKPLLIRVINKVSRILIKRNVVK